MNLLLSRLSLPLDRFSLSLDTRLTAAATGIFGPSGAGKTTLLEIIAGLRRPASGSVKLQDQTLFDSAQAISMPAHKRSVGYVPQDLALFPHLTVRENLEFGPRARRGGQPASWDDIVEILQIGPLLSRGIHHLSGGEKQRVAFARALMASPRLLLLDEPLASLDQALKDSILAYLARIRNELKIPILYVSHSPGEILHLCGEVLLLDHGKVTAQGAPSKLLK